MNDFLATRLRHGPIGPIQRRLFSAAGADARLLASGDPGERVREATLGALLVCIALLNTIASAIVLDIVLMPGTGTDLPGRLEGYGTVALISTAWMLITANLLRFIVSTAACGDSSGASRTRRLVRLLPGLFVATVLGLCVSLPVTIAITHLAVGSQLTGSQQRSLLSLIDAIDRKYESTLSVLYQDQVIDLGQRESLGDRLRSLAGVEAALGAGTAHGLSPGQAYRVTERADTQRRLVALEADIARRQDEIDTLRTSRLGDRAAVVQSVQRERSLRTETSKVFSRASEVFWGVAVFIVLLHLVPIAIRFRSHRGPYAYRVDFQNDVALARHGIAPGFSTLRGTSVDRFLVAERILSQQRATLRRFAVLAARERAARAQAAQAQQLGAQQ